MSDDEQSMERRLNREDLFKLAAAAGGASLLAGRAGAARAALDRLTAESGRLQVLDWAGYGNDGGQSMFAAVRQGAPGEQAAVHVHDQRVRCARRSSMPGSSRTSSVRTSAG